MMQGLNYDFLNVDVLVENNLKLHYFNKSSINDDLVNKLFKIIKDNLEFRYMKSKFLPWNKQTKLAELTDPLTEFFVIEKEDNSIASNIAAFISFQSTVEEDMDNNKIPVLYCYELHVIKDLRGIGLGKFLLKLIENECKKRNLNRIMMTCFKPIFRFPSYKSPLQFYFKNGYLIDNISPSKVLKGKDSKDYDYEILSKLIN
jgi:GNAT superfamily N-acetyltransferase